jgi:hypothetical protein
MTKRAQFTVSFVMPPGATLKEAKEYIVDAVASMKGSYRPPASYDETDPGDPMFRLDGDTVKVVGHKSNFSSRKKRLTKAKRSTKAELA